MKYLLVALVILVAIHIWRKNRNNTSARAPQQSLRQPEDMVTCAHCGLHLPASDAIQSKDQLHYCSHAHCQLGPR